MKNQQSQPGATSGNLALLVKLLALVALIYVTNPGAGDEFALLIQRKQFFTLIPFSLIWASSLVALSIAAFHPKIIWRFFWGTLISASAASAMAYYWMSHTSLSIFDIIAGWNAAHEAGRAASFYAQDIYAGIALFVLSLIVFLWPTRLKFANFSRLLRWSPTLPLLPIAMIAAAIFIKNGTLYGTMPNQFGPLSMASLFMGKLELQKLPERLPVAWTSQHQEHPQNIVYLVDESVRGDFIDLTPGNPYTPKFAKLADQFVNFGNSVSAGNCSNYSNALLRFGASRMNLSATVNTNATVFDYAKHAGYRTVFIDAQAPSLTLGNDYQNFMTVQERSVIDHVFLLHDVEPQDADEALGKIIAGELRQGGPVFIYANKNGAHFPYDHSYPASAAIFHPTMTESAADTVKARSNSFRNGIAWSVDRFMEQLFAETDFKDTTMIYTSDHGQQLMPGKLTHCQAEKPDQMMSVVPLMVHTSDPDLRKKFEAGAAVLQNKASHFQIAPTLYSLMGYRAEDIAKQYDESLFIGTSRPAESTSGDVFGLFRPSQNWNAVDLQAISSEQNPALVVKAKPITANVGG